MAIDTDKSLCALKEEGFIDTDTEIFKTLIQPATAFCRNCGRSAVSEDNLCKPEKV